MCGVQKPLDVNDFPPFFPESGLQKRVGEREREREREREGASSWRLS